MKTTVTYCDECGKPIPDGGGMTIQTTVSPIGKLHGENVHAEVCGAHCGHKAFSRALDRFQNAKAAPGLCPEAASLK